GKIVDVPMEISENSLDASTNTAAGFLDSAGSVGKTGESLLGNLPAAKQGRELLVIGRDAANGEEEKTSLLQKIADRHQFGDDDPGRK
ncbi:MAG: hypothetical protein GWP07_05920, partial [Xanthomonadaceae bacterium]|nr:hypothetical protein [Xanthomonadaceae bacterium]